jgi:choline monooxygenase
VVCPLHRWTYDASGPGAKLSWARRTFPHDPCLEPPRTDRKAWNGLLFDLRNDTRLRAQRGRELAALGQAADLDFSGYVFDRAIMHECDYNWKTFIEVYLEDYHVGPFHPGLGSS